MKIMRRCAPPYRPAYSAPGGHALIRRLRAEQPVGHIFGSPDVDPADVQSEIEEAQTLGVALDTTTLEYKLRKTLERLSELSAARRIVWR